MRIYIDAGAFKGETLQAFPFPEYKRIAFECNPLLKNFKYSDDITIIRKAIWTYDGILPFYINPKDPETTGCSLFKDKSTGDLDKDNPLQVECINFSSFLLKKYDGEPEITVKMNVEGAEYPVLEHCLKTGAIYCIDTLHVYWHIGKINISQQRHNDLVSQLKGVFGQKLIERI